jgi:peptidoglycan hydrolase-like protein with peptidoglycan-binding domain
MNGRVALTGTLALALVVAAGAGARLLPATAASAGSPAPSAGTDTRPTAAVERRSLAEQVTLTGTLGYPKATPLKSGVAGTVTRLPAEGSLLSRGQPTGEIDGRPTGFLLFGDRPAWRDLGPSATPGPDILALKENLRALGYLPGTTALTSAWDPSTTAAIKSWQKALGLPITVGLPLGSVVFRPGPLRVGAQTVALGDAIGPGTPLYDTTDATAQVTAELRADLRHLVHVGDQVSILLPGGATAKGSISTIGAVAHPSPDGSSTTITLSVTLDDPSVAASYDQATVSVAITTAVAKDVLAVPVTALLALRGGGYAVEVVRGPTSQLVPVVPGMFASGEVAVTGTGLAAGDLVVVAK